MINSIILFGESEESAVIAHKATSPEIARVLPTGRIRFYSGLRFNSRRWITLKFENQARTRFSLDSFRPRKSPENAKRDKPGEHEGTVHHCDVRERTFSLS